MKDKYYTPSLEEFHVGFEFEFFDMDDDDWTPVVIKTQSDLCHWTAFDDIGKRIKHLDREDIESFGYKFLKKGWGEESVIFRSDRTVGYEIYFRGLGSVHITLASGGVLFEGIAKNKSELKRILQQIGAI